MCMRLGYSEYCDDCGNYCLVIGLPLGPLKGTNVTAADKVTRFLKVTCKVVRSSCKNDKKFGVSF